LAAICYLSAIYYLLPAAIYIWLPQISSAMAPGKVKVKVKGKSKGKAKSEDMQRTRR